MSDDRPPELLDLLDAIADNMEPLSPEELALLERWNKKLEGRL